MSERTQEQFGYRDGKLPDNVRIGDNTLITGSKAFHSFRAKLADALSIGANGTFDGVSFAIGKEGRLRSAIGVIFAARFSYVKRR